MAAADAPDVVLGYRLKRADPPIRRWYARIYRLSKPDLLRGSVRDIDCACKLFKREALTPIASPRAGHSSRRAADQASLRRPKDCGSRRAALRQDGRLSDRRQAERRVQAVRDFWSLRLRLWFRRKGAMQRGEPILG